MDMDLDRLIVDIINNKIPTRAQATHSKSEASEAEETSSPKLERKTEQRFVELQKPASKPCETVQQPKDERIDLLKEIVTTEKTYYRDLGVLVQGYLHPIQKSCLLSKAEVTAIFSNIEPIYELHNQLVERLDKEIGDNPITSSIKLGAVFLHLASFLKMYTTYCNGYKAALEKVYKLEKEQPAFQTFLQAAQAKPEHNSLHLKDYLIKPIQRLCKYPLLFRELLQVTPEDHPDYNYVQQTQEKVNSVAQSVNENAAELRNYEKISLFNRMVSGYEIDVSTFWYIRDEILTEKNSSRNRHVYLMTHMLILTKITGGMSKIRKEKFIVAINLSRAELRQQVGEREFEIVDNNLEKPVVYRFICPSIGSKANWVNDIKEACDNAKNFSGFKSPRNAYYVVETPPVEEKPKLFKKFGRSNSQKNVKSVLSDEKENKASRITEVDCSVTSECESVLEQESVGSLSPLTKTKGKSIKSSGNKEDQSLDDSSAKPPRKMSADATLSKKPLSEKSGNSSGNSDRPSKMSKITKKSILLAAKRNSVAAVEGLSLLDQLKHIKNSANSAEKNIILEASEEKDEVGQLAGFDKFQTNPTSKAKVDFDASEETSQTEKKGLKKLKSMIKGDSSETSQSGHKRQNSLANVKVNTGHPALNRSTSVASIPTISKIPPCVPPLPLSNPPLSAAPSLTPPSAPSQTPPSDPSSTSSPRTHTSAPQVSVHQQLQQQLQLRLQQRNQITSDGSSSVSPVISPREIEVSPREQVTAAPVRPVLRRLSSQQSFFSHHKADVVALPRIPSEMCCDPLPSVAPVRAAVEEKIPEAVQKESAHETSSATFGTESVLLSIQNSSIPTKTQFNPALTKEQKLRLLRRARSKTEGGTNSDDEEKRQERIEEASDGKCDEKSSGLSPKITEESAPVKPISTVVVEDVQNKCPADCIHQKEVASLRQMNEALLQERQEWKTKEKMIEEKIAQLQEAISQMAVWKINTMEKEVANLRENLSECVNRVGALETNKKQED